MTDTGAALLPLTVVVCATDALGSCLGPPGPSTTVFIAPGGQPTFAFFVAATAPIALDPATHRIFVRFKDSGGATRGATSVAAFTP